MKSLYGKNVILRDGELLAKETDNRSYLDELKSPALLQNFYQEAGMNQNFGSKYMAHTGWEDPSCQLRGHFLGHYLSACAMRYFENSDEELLAKANHIVHELHRCQEENGGLWAASIPEKYFYWIAKGKQVWAPHYNVHKTFMGLCDMYRYTGSNEALEVAVSFARWFYDFTDGKTREEMDNILDFETGGMLEVWADLYEFTKDDMFLELIDRYDRHRLFDKLLDDVDVLTNMHANTTIPEAIGAARVYEVTGKERYKNIALKYWEMAVTKRGSFVTGGQTCGEIWTPLRSMGERLGDKNQEHCTVYNMIRLADILFKWTGKVEFLDYIEQNLYNGIMAQGYFRGGHTNGQTSEFPDEGLITYFLPMAAGLRKGWGQKFSDFFCCHGTLVQANAAHNKYLYYLDGDAVYTVVYASSKASFRINGTDIILEQYRDTLSGSFHSSSTSSALQAVGDNTHIYPHQPDLMKQCFKVSAGRAVEFTLCLRLPKWLRRDAELTVNGKIADISSLAKDGFIRLKREFQNGDEICLSLPLDLYATRLEGSDNMYAFSYGPIVLAGLSDAERTLHLKGHALSELLTHDNEREWGSWKETFKTRFQDVGIRFLPLKNIGYERYQLYFPVED